jgi:hypothetical protein
MMNRSQFVQKLAALGVCPFVVQRLNAETKNSEENEQPLFIENWLTDLLNTMEDTISRESQVKLIEGCGRGCFNRHQFKKDIAVKGEGDVDKLVEAYTANFEIWKATDGIHIRYGETSSRCYCPVVKNIPPKPDDIHCECTKATHQSIFEAALNRQVKVSVVESLRRGGKTCHFLVNV